MPAQISISCKNSEHKRLLAELIESNNNLTLYPIGLISKIPLNILWVHLPIIFKGYSLPKFPTILIDLTIITGEPL